FWSKTNTCHFRERAASASADDAGKDIVDRTNVGIIAPRDLPPNANPFSGQGRTPATSELRKLYPRPPVHCSGWLSAASSGGAAHQSREPVSVSVWLFCARIDGVKVTPTSSPSGEMKRLTICPHGSFLFLTSIRYPAESRAAVAFSTLSTSNSSHACGAAVSAGQES